MGGKPGWHGRFYEDFAVGDVYRHRLGRTISEADNTWFTLLTLNTNPSHFNVEYAKRMEFGKLLVNSAFTLALVTGLSVSDLSENAVANLGWGEITLPHPVHVGDTLYAESEVLEMRESRSRPYAGIVKVRTRGLNQHGVVVIESTRTFMVYKREAAPARNLFPEPAVERPAGPKERKA
ncbi:MAG: MaoC family dehydratase [Candidatus Rokubacteria bacterium]|nr:MaoC family dehydratase [Candidatus Rokubacteria bacterium]